MLHIRGTVHSNFLCSNYCYRKVPRSNPGQCKPRYFYTLVPAVRIDRAMLIWWLDKSNHVIGQFVAEVIATDIISVIRPSKFTDQLSNFKVLQSTDTNQLINCLSCQNRSNIDLSLLKIAVAALVQLLQTLVNISSHWPEKQLINRYKYMAWR